MPHCIFDWIRIFLFAILMILFYFLGKNVMGLQLLKKLEEMNNIEIKDNEDLGEAAYNYILGYLEAVKQMMKKL